MNEREYHEMQENAATGQMIAANLQAILDDHDCENVAQLYRTIYKYTDCGPWLSVQLHDGTWRHCDNLHGIDNGNVRALKVGSIVEGSDAEVEADPIDLIRFDEEGGEQLAVTTFNAAVEWVNDEASALWDDANGDESDDEVQA